MSWLIGLFSDFSTVASGTVATIALYQQITAWFRKKSQAFTSDEELRKWLTEMGTTTDETIRQFVKDWAKKNHVSASQQEELIPLLINLAHGVRFHTTHGTAVSKFKKNAALLEQLLSNIQPQRKKGEPVGHGWEAWILERFLGMGSFGEVWMARNPMVPKPYAFKFFTQADAKDWLIREQQALHYLFQRLKGHPNIVSFENVVILNQPWPFLVFEYVGGSSLEDWIQGSSEQLKQLDKSQIVEDIVKGLSKAHEAGICHRDMKPANILLTNEAHPGAKIADFGLGQIARKTATSHLSSTFAAGTDMYLPPEALNPYVTRDSFKDDVFAVGVIWYQLATECLERPPYDFADRLKETGVDSGTIQVISRCLTHPDRRFPNAEVLEDALGDGIPFWNPIPEEHFDVQWLAREYLFPKQG